MTGRDEYADARQNAQAWYESIKEMVENLEKSRENDKNANAVDIIQNSVLSVEVRSTWYIPGAKNESPDEYRILLTTGGPALQLVGDLNEYCEPTSAKLEMQDWGIPWTQFSPKELNADCDCTYNELYERCIRYDKILLRFASCFYFGE